jgi:hypothetical protein
MTLLSKQRWVRAQLRERQVGGLSQHVHTYAHVVGPSLAENLKEDRCA